LASPFVVTPLEFYRDLPHWKSRLLGYCVALFA